MPNWKPRNTKRARELRNAATPAERELWKYLSSRGVEGRKFCRQMEVGPFYPDFVCREFKLIVEIDGYSHDMTVAKDVKRTEYLESLGYSVLRFTNDDVLGNAEGVVSMIAAWFADMPTPNPSRRREGNV